MTNGKNWLENARDIIFLIRLRAFVVCCILNFSFLFFIESSWTSSPPRPPSPPQSQTSFDTLSRNPKFFENSKKKNANDLTNLNWHADDWLISKIFHEHTEKNLSIWTTKFCFVDIGNEMWPHCIVYKQTKITCAKDPISLSINARTRLTFFYENLNLLKQAKKR